MMKDRRGCARLRDLPWRPGNETAPSSSSEKKETQTPGTELRAKTIEVSAQTASEWDRGS